MKRSAKRLSKVARGKNRNSLHKLHLASKNASGGENVHNKTDSTGDLSLLGQLCKLFEESGAANISFEDLTGVAYDVPDMRLLEEYRYHTCKFCMFAKSRRSSLQDCMRNKQAVNRLAVRRQEGFRGQCHLGLTDLVEPLVFKGRVLGVFYYGSLVVDGTEAEARRRINRYCARKKMDPAPFLARLKAAAKIDDQELEKYRKQLIFVVQFAQRLLEAYGLPLERYKTEMWIHKMNLRHEVPMIVQAAIRYVHGRYAEQVRLSTVADFIKCHPDYLSRLFKKSMSCGFEEYLSRVRVDHARLLLETNRYSLGEVGFLVGFQEQTHFGRVFKRFTALTPGQYRQKMCAPSATHREQAPIHFPPDPAG